MNWDQKNFRKSKGITRQRLAAAAILLAGFIAMPSLAQQPGQKTFSTAEEAGNALATAAQTNDEKGMLEILGAEGREIVSSGDDVEDAQNHANFAKKYQQMHRFVKEPDGSTVIYIGAENWPAPIPLIKKDSLWYFDSAAGKKEILYRRVGRNEMWSIMICQELVAAEQEYLLTLHNGYAQKIFSSEGQHDGLYWKAGDGEPQSPIGPRVAEAVAEGYVKGQDGPATPYHGYLYHILTRQGKNASGGAKSYVANGKMTEGFAVVAYPAEYRSSGVMTFIIDSDGVVYQKDLGKKTETLGKAMKEYNPDSSWQKTEGQQEQAAGEGKSKS